MWTAIESLPFLWQGLLVTLQVSFLVVAISLVIGVVMGVGLDLRPALAVLADPGCTAT